jgi:hypothetical protein
MTRNRIVAIVVALVAVAGPAQAYDPASTHAGLTQRGIEASHLHAVLTRKLGRALGLLEPLRLGAAGSAQGLALRLDALDPAGGYRPAPDNSSTASNWVVAGAVLAKTPPERGRNHFLDPRMGAGLHDSPGLTGMAHATGLLFSGGTTVRGLATGTAFDLEGKPSVKWIWAPENEFGVPAFLDAWERAVALPQAAARETALVQGLLALGGLAAVLEDAGDPAFVRNDFRVALLGGRNGSTYESYVTEQFGRIGVPAATAPVHRPDIDSFFAASDGLGLANRTQRRFFSEGNLPSEITLDRDAEAVLRDVRESLTFPSPSIARLVLTPGGATRYLVFEGRRTLAYRVRSGKLIFFLDRAIFADSARWLLPQIGGYVAGLIDHLLRADLDIKIEGGKASVALSGPGSTGGPLRVFAETADGVRTEIPEVLALTPGATVTVAIPNGTRRIAAVVRGQDQAGPFVAAAEIPLP